MGETLKWVGCRKTRGVSENDPGLAFLCCEAASIPLVALVKLLVGLIRLMLLAGLWMDHFTARSKEWKED